jgi:hypothetical protein
LWGWVVGGQDSNVVTAAVAVVIDHWDLWTEEEAFFYDEETMYTALPPSPFPSPPQPPVFDKKAD